MHSPHPKGTWPGRASRRWITAISSGTTTRKFRSPRRGGKYRLAGKRLLQDYEQCHWLLSDEWFYNGTPGTEKDWSIGGEYKCTVTEDHWDMEMSIRLAAFREKKLDGKSWVLQLLRADNPGGVYFAGWVGELDVLGSVSAK